MIVFVSVLFSTLVLAQKKDSDVIHLSTTIEGSREQPRVLNIVPWSTPPMPDTFDPFAHGFDHVVKRVLTPVERVELKRRLSMGTSD